MSHMGNLKSNIQQLATLLAASGIIVEAERNTIRFKIPIVEQLKSTISLALQQASMQFGTLPIPISITSVDYDDTTGRARIIIDIDIGTYIEKMLRNVPFRKRFENGTLILELDMPR